MTHISNIWGQFEVAEFVDFDSFVAEELVVFHYVVHFLDEVEAFV